MSDMEKEAERRVVEVRRIAWRDVLPEVLLGRCFGIAFQVRAMLLGGIGSAIALMGARRILDLFGPCTGQLRFTDDFLDFSGPLMGIGPVTFSFGLRGVTAAVLIWLWMVVVWSVFGGWITRSAAIQLTTGRRDRFWKTVKFGARKFPSYLGTAIVPLLAVTVVTVLLGVHGWLMALIDEWLYSMTTSIVGVLTGWIVLAIGFLGTLLLIGGVLGFPLMVAAISVEGSDAFDGVARGIHFLLRRPMRILVYLLMVAVPGVIGAGIVWFFFAVLMGFTSAGLAIWGGMNGLYERCPWLLLLQALAIGYVMAYFWTAMTAIYLLLRRHLDGTPLDEVLEESETGAPPQTLPIIRTDMAGAPVMDPAADGTPVSDQPEVSRD